MTSLFARPSTKATHISFETALSCHELEDYLSTHPKITSVSLLLRTSPPASGSNLGSCYLTSCTLDLHGGVDLRHLPAQFFSHLVYLHIKTDNDPRCNFSQAVSLRTLKLTERCNHTHSLLRVDFPFPENITSLTHNAFFDLEAFDNLRHWEARGPFLRTKPLQHLETLSLELNDLTSQQMHHPKFYGPSLQTLHLRGDLTSIDAPITNIPPTVHTLALRSISGFSRHINLSSIRIETLETSNPILSQFSNVTSIKRVKLFGSVNTSITNLPINCRELILDEVSQVPKLNLQVEILRIAISPTRKQWTEIPGHVTVFYSGRFWPMYLHHRDVGAVVRLTNPYLRSRVEGMWRWMDAISTPEMMKWNPKKTDIFFSPATEWLEAETDSGRDRIPLKRLPQPQIEETSEEEDEEDDDDDDNNDSDSD